MIVRKSTTIVFFGAFTLFVILSLSIPLISGNTATINLIGQIGEARADLKTSTTYILHIVAVIYDGVGYSYPDYTANGQTKTVTTGVTLVKFQCYVNLDKTYESYTNARVLFQLKNPSGTIVYSATLTSATSLVDHTTYWTIQFDTGTINVVLSEGDWVWTATYQVYV